MLGEGVRSTSGRIHSFRHISEIAGPGFPWGFYVEAVCAAEQAGAEKANITRKGMPTIRLLDIAGWDGVVWMELADLRSRRLSQDFGSGARRKRARPASDKISSLTSRGHGAETYAMEPHRRQTHGAGGAAQIRASKRALTSGKSLARTSWCRKCHWATSRRQNRPNLRWLNTVRLVQQAKGNKNKHVYSKAKKLDESTQLSAACHRLLSELRALLFFLSYGRMSLGQMSRFSRRQNTFQQTISSATYTIAIGCFMGR